MKQLEKSLTCLKYNTGGDCSASNKTKIVIP